MFVKKKREVIMEELKNNILIENLNLQDKTKEILKKAGYRTIGDLASAKMEDVEKHFIEVKESGIWGYDGSYSFRVLKALLHHDYKVTFEGEYEHLGLKPEIANTPTASLQLPTAIKNVLTGQLMAYTLGDILTTDYKRFLKARNLGEKYLEVLKNYVHKLGYKLKDEEPTLKEILASLKEKGVKLLEETFDDSRIYLPMYRNGIYSLEDLLNYGHEVHKLKGFGPLRQQELAEKMKELNLSFNDVTLNVKDRPARTIDIPKSRPTDAIVEKVRKENDIIRIRIEKKEELVTEYDRLMAERQQLIAREQELDQLIQSKINDMKESISYCRK